MDGEAVELRAYEDETKDEPPPGKRDLLVDLNAGECHICILMTKVPCTAPCTDRVRYR